MSHDWPNLHPFHGWCDAKCQTTVREHTQKKIIEQEKEISKKHRPAGAEGPGEITSGIVLIGLKDTIEKKEKRKRTKSVDTKTSYLLAILALCLIGPRRKRGGDMYGPGAVFGWQQRMPELCQPVCVYLIFFFFFWDWSRADQSRTESGPNEKVPAIKNP